MRVWRVCRRRHAAFDGEGARLAGGRWNEPGTALVYTSATLALAALEFLVHVAHGELPSDLVAIAADIPDRVKRIDLVVGRVPDRDWRRYPALLDLCAWGTRWASGIESAVLAVPSTVIPGERNYLLNPAHPDFREIQIAAPEPFSLGPPGRGDAAAARSRRA
jgi:RES domain-containing protein